MATGEVLACFGLTEPDYGSDAGNLQATGRADGVRRLPHQRPQDLHHQRHHRRARARHGPHGGPGGKGVSAFLVPTDTPGFTANKIHGKLGCARATPPSWCSTTSRSARTRCSAARRAPA
jgi:alkylation response protein AidB-like acyl-CoA dehydrogenase